MQWWKDGLLVRIRVSPEGLALALVYAVACWGARKLSLDQFLLPAAYGWPHCCCARLDCGPTC